jgi:hypothetical protein
MFGMNTNRRRTDSKEKLLQPLELLQQELKFFGFSYHKITSEPPPMNGKYGFMLQ